MKTTSSEHVVYKNRLFFVLTFKTIYVHNIYCTGKSMNKLLSYFGSVDSRIRASNKDLPVQVKDHFHANFAKKLVVQK